MNLKNQKMLLSCCCLYWESVVCGSRLVYGEKKKRILHLPMFVDILSANDLWPELEDCKILCFLTGRTYETYIVCFCLVNVFVIFLSEVNRLNSWDKTHRKTQKHTHTYMCVCLYAERQNTHAYTQTHTSWYSWFNVYLGRKWTKLHEFKSWTRPFAFHISLTPFGNVRIQLLPSIYGKIIK